MSSDYVHETTGRVEKTREVNQTTVVWTIEKFFSLVQFDEFKVYYSPKFIFAQVEWYFQLQHNEPDDPQLMRLYFGSDDRRDVLLEYDLGLKNVDGSVEKFVRAQLDLGNNEETSFSSYFNYNEFEDRKSELSPSDVVTFVCNLKHKSRVSPEPEVLEEPKPKKLKKFHILSENFKHLLLNTDSCDTTLFVRGREYKAHRAILMARSSVFAAMFQHESSEKQTGTIDIPDCDSDSFKKFLEYLYCGSLEGLTSQSALNLYETSNKYDVQELKEFCKEHLLRNVTLENLCDVVIAADKYDDAELSSAAQTFFNKNLSNILVTCEWDCLLSSNRRLADKLMIQMSKKVSFLED